MAGYDLFEILSEVLVQRDGRVAQLGFKKDFGDGPPAANLCSDNRQGPMILLNDNFYTLLYLGEHGMEIAGHFGFAHVHRCHHSNYGPSGGRYSRCG